MLKAVVPVTLLSINEQEMIVLLEENAGEKEKNPNNTAQEELFDDVFTHTPALFAFLQPCKRFKSVTSSVLSSAFSDVQTPPPDVCKTA